MSKHAGSSLAAPLVYRWVKIPIFSLDQWFSTFLLLRPIFNVKKKILGPQNL